MPIKLATRTKTYPVLTTTGVYGVSAFRTWSAMYPDMADLSAQPIMLYTHGGGWTGGGKTGDGWNTWAPIWARIGYVCYTINYTLATSTYPTPLSNGTQFPAPQQDCRSMLGYLGAGNGVGGNTAKITVWGNSSGSQLALLMALAPKATFVESENPSTNYTVVASLTQCSPTNLLTMYNQSGVGSQIAIFDHLGFNPNSDTATAALASPAHYVDVNSIRVYCQQGDADAVVPPAQATDLNDVFVAAGAVMQYSMYAGVIHSNDAAWNTPYNYVDNDRRVYLAQRSWT